jgi:hypothetical protein
LKLASLAPSPTACFAFSVLSVASSARAQDLNNNCILDSVEIAADPSLDVATALPVFAVGADGILDEAQGLLPTFGEVVMNGAGNVPLVLLSGPPGGSVDPDAVIVVTSPVHGSTVTQPFRYVLTPSYSGVSDAFTFRMPVCIANCGTANAVYLYSRPVTARVSLGGFPDCNGNGQDDGGEFGCDGNGVPDECEIAADPSLDCDLDGILDSCEINFQPSLDGNGNGVLDACENLAMALNGTSQWMRVASSPTVTLNTMTLECWVNPTNFAARRALLARWKDQGGDDRSYYVGIEAGGAVLFKLARTDNQQDAAFQDFQAGQLVAGQWQHVACTYDGTMRRIFVNGVLAGQRATSGTIHPGSTPLSVGAQLANTAGSGTVQGYLLGAMDEVRLWNHARSESQIRGTLDARMEQFHLYSGLSGRWHLDGDGGVSVGVQGVLQGSPSFPPTVLPVVWSGLATPPTLPATAIVSALPGGAASNDVAGEAVINALNGRYVAFTSFSTNLFPGDTNMLTDVFRRDLSNNALIRVTTGPGGVQGSISREPAPGMFLLSQHNVAIDMTARHVAFISFMDNLVACDTNRTADAFVNDLTNQVVLRVSVSTAGVQANGACASVAISPGGGQIAYASTATNLVASDTNGFGDVFLRSIVTNTTTLVSRRTDGGQATGGSSTNPAVSDLGRFVAFQSAATNLVAGDTNGLDDIFVRDLQSSTTERVSVSSAGVQSNGFSSVPSISADGRYVAFTSTATNIAGFDNNSLPDVFVHDRATHVTTRVSQSTGGLEGDGTSNSAVISLDGRYVAFSSNARTLVPRDSNLAYDVFVRDTLVGETRRMSTGQGGVQGNLDSKVSSIATNPLRVGYTSLSTTLTAGVTHIDGHVYVSTRAEPAPTAVCFGTAAACPCANAGAAGHGCQNSFGTGGALLGATGSAIVSADTLLLTVSSLPLTNQLPTFFQGTSVPNGGAGTGFGDGLRCAGGASIRLGTRTATNGTVSLGFGIAGDPPISVKGAVPALGATRTYQVIYRNVQAYCTPSLFNLSNGLTVIWAP